jgi:hypothetical protein
MHTKDYEKTEVFTEICDSIIAGLDQRKKESKGKTIRKDLLKKLICARALFRRAQNFSDNNSELSDAFLWFCDNFSFIEEEYLFTLEALKNHKGKSGKDGFPIIYTLSLKFLELNDGVLSENSVFALISSYDKAFEGGFEFPEK